MTAPVDLGPPARRVADLVAAVPDDRLADPTPCADTSVGDLLDHVGGLSLAFTAAASKTPLPGGAQGPSADAAKLGDDWRTRIPAQVTGLAEAWRDPQAWTGMTQAGGIDLPGEIAGLVALDELVIHGWDLARATGQAYDVDGASLEAIHPFVAQSAEAGGTPGLFGPPVAVPDDAPLLDRVLGLTGRDPAWTPRP